MVKSPVRFEPLLKEKIWGGDKLKKLLNRESDSKILGESWEISGVKNDISVVQNGALIGKTLSSIIQKCKDQLLGKSNFKKFGADFHF